MTDPKEQRQEPEALDLDAEEVKDLDVPEDYLAEVLGGNSYVAGPTRGSVASK